MQPAAVGFLGYPHLPILLIIGFAIFAGTIGARIFQRLRIPQVVGYIAIGLVAGRSGLGLIDDEAIESLLPFNSFALGVIGFMIGGKLRRHVFKRHGGQFFKILLAEGLGAFFMVSLLVTGTALLLGQTPVASVALGIIFGALSAATAPAATVNVLWEYKTRGPLTTAIYAIVALDDAMAIILFSLAWSVVDKISGHAGGGMLLGLGKAAYELGGAVVLGVAAGVGLNSLLRRARDPAMAFPLILSAVLLTIGAGILLKVDTILASMALGAALANLAPRRSGAAFDMVQRFAPPVYVLFFVMVGAHIHVQKMQAWMWVLALPYLVGFTAGKVIGSELGGRLGRAARVVRKYLGMSLFCQAGVALGLSIVASQRLQGLPGEMAEIGNAIVMVIAVTTFVLEIVGPPCIRFAVRKAGEVGLDVTREDLVRSYTVGQVMYRDCPSFPAGTTFNEIIRTIAETDAMHYPVVDADRKLAGVITIQELKDGMGAQGMADLLVASDLMEPAPDTVAEDAPLAEAVTRMREQGLECMPVVAGADDPRLVGMLELRAVERMLSQEVVRRQQLADARAGEG